MKELIYEVENGFTDKEEVTKNALKEKSRLEGTKSVPG